MVAELKPVVKLLLTGATSEAVPTWSRASPHRTRGLKRRWAMDCMSGFVFDTFVGHIKKKWIDVQIVTTFPKLKAMKTLTNTHESIRTENIRSELSGICDRYNWKIMFNIYQ